MWVHVICYFHPCRWQEKPCLFCTLEFLPLKGEKHPQGPLRIRSGGDTFHIKEGLQLNLKAFDHQHQVYDSRLICILFHLLKCVSASCYYRPVCILSCHFILAVPCALTRLFAQFLQVWITQLPPWWNKALRQLVSYSSRCPNHALLWGNFVSAPHYPSSMFQLCRSLGPLDAAVGTAASWALGKIWKGLLSVWPFVVAVYVFIAVVSMAVLWTEGLFQTDCSALATPGCTSGSWLSLE